MIFVLCENFAFFLKKKNEQINEQINEIVK